MERFCKVIIAALILLIASIPGQAQWQIGQRSFYHASGGSPVITYVTGNGASSGSGTSISTTATVGAGDLDVACAAWDNPATVTVSDGASGFTADSTGQVNAPGGGTSEQCFYLLSANGGARTFTATFSASVANIELSVFSFHTSSGTWHVEASNGAGAASSTSVNTGSITTTHAAAVVVFCGKLYAIAAATSSPLIAGLTPTEPSWSPIGTYDHQYYLLPGTTVSGAGTKTYSPATNWVANLSAYAAY